MLKGQLLTAILFAVRSHTFNTDFAIRHACTIVPDWLEHAEVIPGSHTGFGFQTFQYLGELVKEHNTPEMSIQT